MNSNFNKTTTTCDECESEYFTDTSKMERLCPNCSHYVYGYENCKHNFHNHRCLKCYWDGSSSEYIKSISK